MQLIPAIDVLGGRVVRLSQGAYDAVTTYADDPVKVALEWQAAGGQRIHIVDLDAAREGRPTQAGLVSRVVAALGVPCQVAGGIRGADQVEITLAAGADRVVLGSALISDPSLASRLVAQHGAGRIVAALDVRDGRAVGDGWVRGARSADVLLLARTLADAGIAWFAVTAIAHDGQMSGPDVRLLAQIRDAVPAASIIASGGISSLADIARLAADDYAAAILGRALYDGAFTLEAALAAVSGPSAR